MANHLNIRVPFSDDDIKFFSKTAKDFALMNGLVMRRSAEPDNDDVTSHVSLTLLPTPIPRLLFDDLKSIQCAYLEMYYNAAHDFQFLEGCLKRVADVDDFVRRLFNIHLQVKDRPPNQHRCLCLARNDFMLDSQTSPPQPKQIEINTIAASFGGLGTRLKAYHDYLLNKMRRGVDDMIPPSHLDDKFAEAMVNAWIIYGQKDAVIAFVVEESNRNIYDQRYLENAIYRRCGEVRVVWRTLRYIARHATLREGNLFIDDLEVALVYYRTGYVPELYADEESWGARLLMERSRAVLCPCIHMHLVGCKVVQQVLCREGLVERFVPDAQMSARIRQTFANQYSIEQSASGDAAVQLAMATPDRYVLKPQVEGGGHNTYGQNIVPLLRRLSTSDERAKYILMELIRPPKNDNYLLVPEQGVLFGPTISELGIYVSALGDGRQVTSRVCGHVLRTKLDGMDEGGVMLGISAIDSVLLT